MSDEFKTLRKFDAGKDRESFLYSLPALEEQGIGKISRLPVSIRIVLESVLRNCDGKKVRRKDVEALANWNAKKPANEEIPFVVARIVLQDFTGVPLVVDLSVQVDFFGSAKALQLNLEMEFKRNRERYQFLKWGQQAFQTFQLIPPGIGIVHQVNLEYLAKGVLSAKSANSNQQSEIFYPDTLVGTDSHTTMINGLGVVGWGVGGIEAEAALLGQPITMLIPQVVGFRLKGKLPEGATATDLVLTVTQMLRKHGVVSKFVEFYGPGISALSLPDHAAIANMSPEYGATIGFFPVDAETLTYLRFTGRPDEHVQLVERYCKEAGLFHDAHSAESTYSSTLELDLAKVEPSLAGPKRPQDRIALRESKAKFRSDLAASSGATSNADAIAKAATTVQVKQGPVTYDLKNGAVVIAAITSCTNTSNPAVLIGAGLLAKKAVQRGLE